MIKLRFKEQAIVDLQRFIRNYEEAFFQLYSDTGLWNEGLIIENYRQSAQKLYLTVLKEIEQRLADKKVLGRKSLPQFQELSFYVGDRLVIVYYTDEGKSKTRLIESIGIDRKPIIF